MGDSAERDRVIPLDRYFGVYGESEIPYFTFALLSGRYHHESALASKIHWTDFEDII